MHRECLAVTLATMLLLALSIQAALASSCPPLPTNTPLGSGKTGLWLNASYAEGEVLVEMQVAYRRAVPSADWTLYVVVEIGGGFYSYPALSGDLVPLGTFSLPAWLDTGVFEFTRWRLGAGGPHCFLIAWYAAFVDEQGSLAETGLASSAVLLWDEEPTPTPTRTPGPTHTPLPTPECEVLDTPNPLAGQLHATDSIVGNLRFVPAGRFCQGSPSWEPCRDVSQGVDWEKQFVHTLTRNIAVMESETTRGMWAALKAVQPSLPADPTHIGLLQPGPDHPVQNCTWFEAVLFANLLSVQQGLGQAYFTDAGFRFPISAVNYRQGPFYCNFDATGYRLPTEGEWEYFARAGTVTPFSAPVSGFNRQVCFLPSCTPQTLPDLEAIAWFCANANRDSQPVMMKLPNPWGLYDVHGNGNEWVWDWFQAAYPVGAATDYSGPATGTSRGIRSGSYSSTSGRQRSADRKLGEPRHSGFDTSLRLVRTTP